MNNKAPIFFILVLLSLASCKTYEVKHFKGNEFNKAGDVSKDQVYIHAHKGLFKIKNPIFTPASIIGDAQPVKDAKEAEDIENPVSAKKHRHDLNVYTKTEIKDTAANVTLRKSDINEFSLVEAHSKVNWDKVGDVVKDVLGVAVCVVIIGAVVYWFSFI